MIDGTYSIVEIQLSAVLHAMLSSPARIDLLKDYLIHIQNWAMNLVKKKEMNYHGGIKGVNTGSFRDNLPFINLL